MANIYIDFDNTIVKSNKAFIEVLNNRYGLHASEDDLKDYDYSSIKKISNQEKLEIFESDEFFNQLEFQDGFLETFKKIKKNNIIIVTKGTAVNLDKKEIWLKKNLKRHFQFIGIEDLRLSKKCIDMEDGFQIDDCTNALDTNAKVKILYKNYRNYKWQQDYENKDMLVVNDWKQIKDIIKFYTKYDYKTLKRTR